MRARRQVGLPRSSATASRPQDSRRTTTKATSPAPSRPISGRSCSDAGVHARSAVGVAVLPLDSPVEVELILRIRWPCPAAP
ncbi:hypothetical protein C5C27_16250 [Rathayibacter sp. AY2B7]|nr:hypothetical protein C5C27_16250 [Rathayibacter sp. AY2B7]